MGCLMLHMAGMERGQGGCGGKGAVPLLAGFCSAPVTVRKQGAVMAWMRAEEGRHRVSCC